MNYIQFLFVIFIFMKCICFSIILFISIVFPACSPSRSAVKEDVVPEQFIMITGIAQDAGYPQAGCQKACCAAYRSGEVKQQFATSLGLVDRKADKVWLFEATPDIKMQMDMLAAYKSTSPVFMPDGIFLTHAHIGHYTGLMHVGHEVMGAKSLPVYAMPRMRDFLTNNGPWSQLVNYKNIALQELSKDVAVDLGNGLRVTPFRVPHRDEFSETVGYKIESANKKVLFIPDIDKWHKWERDIKAEIQQVDLALLDGTFLKNGELPNRDMSAIPHPFVEESMALFSDLPEREKNKIMFIHFNHTNPLIWDAKEREAVQEAGFQVAEERKFIDL